MLRRIGALRKNLIINRRFLCSRNDDIKIFERHQGEWRKVWFLLEKLQQSKYQELLGHYYHHSILPRYNIFSALSIFASLCHPLLLKYKFDPVDFMKGAKVAYNVLAEGIASKEFSDFSNGFITVSHKQAQLENVLHPRIYQVAKEAVKDMHAEGTSTVVQDVNVLSHTLADVQLHIVNAQEEPHPHVIPYPVGAVVATVLVDYEVIENVNFEVKTFGPVSVVAQKKATWAFQGCISGQEELNWRVVAFDGVGGGQF